jgi:hypothetical protein
MMTVFEKWEGRVRTILVYQLVYHIKGNTIEVNYGLPHAAESIRDRSLDTTL